MSKFKAKNSKIQSTSVKNETSDNNLRIPFNIISCLFLSSIFGYYHMIHIENLFENDKHFSHLSSLERELSFRTESGLYYYYFKNLVVDKDQNPLNNTSILQLINEKIVNDKRTEYPLTINSVQRFNLYPEIVAAFFYRLANGLNLLKKTCWKIERDQGMPAVQSCEGYLEPIYFYSKSVFILNGFSMMFLFILCWSLNNRSILAGIIGCLCYFYNHGEATRVMWTPALRESFSIPFHILQLLALTNFIQSESNNTKSKIFLTLSTLIFLLPWQFAQFSLGTQAASIFFTYSLGFLSRGKLVDIIRSQSTALIFCYVLMFANRMLMTSFFASLLCSIWMILLLEKILKIQEDLLDEDINKKVLKMIIKAVLRVLLLGFFTITIKKYFLQQLFHQEDDSHIWDILKSKFNDESHTFDTRLYTCAREFDFIELETFYKLAHTFLLPVAVSVFIFYGILMLSKFLFVNYPDKDLLKPNLNQDAVILYNLFQVIAFSLMAFMIMRLKLFWTPHLGILASFIANKTEHNVIDFVLVTFRWMRNKPKKDTNGMLKKVIVIGVIAVMSFQGIENIKEQYKIQGEYSDYTMERIMNWINTNTRVDDAFVGAMPTMANIKLSTDRPIINHPHYEDVDLRERTKNIYSHLYGFRPVEELHSLLKTKYKAKYLVLEMHYCRGSPPGKPECSMLNIAHLHLNKTSNRQSCDRILDQDDFSKKYFLKVFSAAHINIFKVI